MISEEESELLYLSLPLFGSNNSRKENITRKKTSSFNVIFRHFKHTMQIYSLIPILLIFFISAAISDCQTSNVQQQDAEFSPSNSRIKRWANEDEEEVAVLKPDLKQQSTSIPAANPNFEAAFQGRLFKDGQN